MYTFKSVAIHTDLTLVNIPVLTSRATAGASADRRFKELRRAWRQRVLRRVRLPLFTAFGTLYVIQAARGGLYDLDWWLGFLIGVIATTYAAVADDPPDHIERWRRGAEGERRTAKKLKALHRDGWRVAHDLADRGRGNRDHVVAGPGGVFLIDTKWLRGPVTVRGEVVHVASRDDPDDRYELSKLATAARGAAARLKEDIVRDTGQRGLWIDAVIVFWNDFEQRVVEGDRVTFVHGDALADWLRGRPVVQQQAKTEAIAAALKVAARAAA